VKSCACARNQWLWARDRARNNERRIDARLSSWRKIPISFPVKRTTIAIDETNDDRDRFRVEPIDFSR